MDRYITVCIPGRREDGADSRWFVLDREAAPHDRGRSLPCHDRADAIREARRRNQSNKERSRT